MQSLKSKMLRNKGMDRVFCFSKIIIYYKEFSEIFEFKRRKLTFEGKI